MTMLHWERDWVVGKGKVETLPWQAQGKEQMRRDSYGKQGYAARKKFLFSQRKKRGHQVCKNVARKGARHWKIFW